MIFWSIHFLHNLIFGKWSLCSVRLKCYASAAGQRDRAVFVRILYGISTVIRDIQGSGRLVAVYSELNRALDSAYVSSVCGAGAAKDDAACDYCCGSLYLCFLLV